MGTEEKRENGGHKAAIRQENERTILAAAEELFAEYGLKGATTVKIAERARLPKANLHYYFPTKQDLYKRLIEDVCDEWLAAANNVMDRNSDPADVLRRYIDAKMELSRRRPHGSRVWASEILGGAKFTSDYISVEVKNWLANCETVITGWIEDGKLAPIDPKALMYMIWATTQHYADFGAQIEILNNGKPLSDAQFDKAKETVTTVILRGVGAI